MMMERHRLAFLVIITLGTYLGFTSFLQTWKSSLLEASTRGLSEYVLAQSLKTTPLGLRDKAPGALSRTEKEIQRCLETDGNDDRVARKAPFAIVQSHDANFTGSDFDLATSTTRCYAKRHGGLYFTDVWNNDQYDGKNFYYSRWVSLRDRYWHEAEWLLGTDGDIVAVGFQNNLLDILNQEEGAEVIIHTRETLEVRAAFVAFRTRSAFARCFLDAWIRMGESPEKNFDNGDLLQLTLELLAPDLAEACKRKRPNYDARYVPCFAQLYQRLIDGKTEKVPLKIYFPMEGFLRSFEGIEENKQHPLWARSCVKTDIFLHGWKKIGHFFHEQSVYACDSLATQEMALLPACSRHNITVDALYLAKKHCYWHYPGCRVNGFNVCRGQKHCQKTLGGITGAGVIA